MRRGNREVRASPGSTAQGQFKPGEDDAHKYETRTPDAPTHAVTEIHL